MKSVIVFEILAWCSSVGHGPGVSTRRYQRVICSCLKTNLIKTMFLANAYLSANSTETNWSVLHNCLWKSAEHIPAATVSTEHLTTSKSTSLTMKATSRGLWDLKRLSHSIASILIELHNLMMRRTIAQTHWHYLHSVTKPSQLVMQQYITIETMLPLLNGSRFAPFTWSAVKWPPPKADKIMFARKQACKNSAKPYFFIRIWLMQMRI